MFNQQLFEYINKRKSSRKYDMKPLPEEACRDIEAQMEGLVPLVV